MKVLLFVDGPKGPKCQAWCISEGGEWAKQVVDSAAAYGLMGKRWWLVECVSAKEGRLLIAQLSIGEACRTVAGRILARGGGA